MLPQKNIHFQLVSLNLNLDHVRLHDVDPLCRNGTTWSSIWSAVCVPLLNINPEFTLYQLFGAAEEKTLMRQNQKQWRCQPWHQNKELKDAKKGLIETRVTVEAADRRWVISLSIIQLVYKSHSYFLCWSRSEYQGFPRFGRLSSSSGNPREPRGRISDNWANRRSRTFPH